MQNKKHSLFVNLSTKRNSLVVLGILSIAVILRFSGADISYTIVLDIPGGTIINQFPTVNLMHKKSNIQVVLLSNQIDSMVKKLEYDIKLCENCFGFQFAIVKITKCVFALYSE